MGSFLAHNGFILIILSNYWLLNIGLCRFDSRLICAHFRLYCGKIIPIIQFYNSIMGFHNFEHGQNNSMMGYYSFKNGLVNYTLWTYVLPMMACLMENYFNYGHNNLKYRIILRWLWAYLFHIMDLCFSHGGLSYGNDNSIMG